MRWDAISDLKRHIESKYNITLGEFVFPLKYLYYFPPVYYFLQMLFQQTMT